MLSWIYAGKKTSFITWGDFCWGFDGGKGGEGKGSVAL
jgi:hypothetical protein